MAWVGADAPVVLAGPLSGPRSAHAPLLHFAAQRLTSLGMPFLLMDDEARPEAAHALALRLVHREVAAVIGHFNSACAEAVLPVYRAHGLSLLLPTASHDGLTAGGGFRLCARDSQQAELMLHVLKRRGINASETELVTDGSPYSERLLAALAAASGGLTLSRVPPEATPARHCRLRIVLATCHGALDIAQRLRNWHGLSLYADDSHVEAFAREAPSSRTLVVGPVPDYQHLIAQACDLVAQARAANASRLDDWLTACGFFDIDGNSLTACWRVHALRSDASWCPTDD